MDIEETRTYYQENLPARKLVLFAVCMGSFLAPISLATVNIALPAIAEYLQADAVLVSWMPMTFLLSNIIFLLPMGKLSDSYGRKRLFLLGLITISLSSILASTAGSIEWLLLYRAIQGLGASMLFGAGLAIITSVYPANERGVPLGINSASIYIGLTIAPLLGGWATEFFGWRSVFLVQIPIALIPILLFLFRVKGEWRKKENESFDWTGSILFTFWAITFVYGMAGLPEWQNIISLVASVPVMLVFIMHQAKNPHPLIRVQIFRENRIFSFSLAASSFLYGSSYPIAFLMSLFLQFILGMSPVDAGKYLLVQALSMTVIAPVAGRLSDIFEPRFIATGGCLLVSGGFLLLGNLSYNTPGIQVIIAMAMLGLGMGLFSSPNNNAVMSSVEHHELGMASASVNLARVNGNLVGMSIVTLIVHSIMGNNPITPDQFDGLLKTVNIAMLLSMSYAFIAAMLSLARGKIR